ncbi:MAG: hypothetical protein HKN26_17140, partial [Acidimicrobiales bacterium]|nr:hypothetical protein [Acidimicrobiales bacterium]
MVTQADVERFQMAGQDIPHLIDLWADTQPDTPLLVWEPRDGAAQTWT